MAVTEKKKTASKPKTTAKKKTSSASIRLSAAEKKLVQNYRKCNAIEKKVIDAAVAKAAEGMDVKDLLGSLMK